MKPDNGEAIPVQIIKPWLTDNEAFIKALEVRNNILEKAYELRAVLALRTMEMAKPCALEAVDAAVAGVSIGDLITVLVQTIRVMANDDVVCKPPVRVSGVNSEELSILRIPLRVTEECTELAPSKLITIADTSFWSMLIETNNLIGSFHNNGAHIPELAQAYKVLIKDGVFLEMLRNPAVIAMTKRNQTNDYSKNKFVSDRELLGRALESGEFIKPQKLVDIVGGRFGIEQRGFTDAEQKEIRAVYDSGFGVTFFKPHPWERAFRIEAQLTNLLKDDWLMPLLNAITEGTVARNREPWPQFMSDYATKRLSAVCKLYGDANISRSPYFDPVRTLR